MQTRKGQNIEDQSMQVIDDGVGPHSYDELEWPIVRRMIHSTADFDFAGKNKIIFHKDAISSGMSALKNGCSIICDVNGLVGLLNKQNPKDFGNEVICNISDSSVIEAAKKDGKTRAEVSMRLVASEMNGGIVAIGNAPTALYEVLKMVKEGVTKPALIIGIPVGFIAAAESKDELCSANIPFITNVGRKGGSSCAAATINALFKLIRRD